MPPIRRFLIPLFAVLLLAGPLAAEWPRPIVDDPNLDDRRELLLRHGISPEGRDLLRFLREGFRESALPNGLPRNPPLKSTVVNAAIVELGVTGHRSAVPLLIEIADKKIPSGAERIINRDFEGIPLGEIDRQVERMHQFLSLNAIVALGLIGEPDAEEVITKRMTREGTPAFITRGALALGQMGSKKGISHLVSLAKDVESPDSVEAFRNIFILTGRNYGVTTNTSLARRREMVKQLGEWYSDNIDSLTIHRADVMRRLSNPPPELPAELGSLRGLLRKSRDLSDFDGRIAANRQLGRTASNSFDELRSITEDEMEDLDIRRAAMQWLASADPRRARSIIRRQTRDENETIAESARYLLEDIDRELARR